MNTEVATKKQEVSEQELATIEKKRAAWGKLGVDIYTSEMQLQARAQQIKLAIKHPSTIEEVPEAEKKLASLRKDYNTLKNDRIALTSKFDAVSTRLMEPEKSLVDPLTKYNDSIVVIKKKHEEDEKKKLGKLQEEKDLTEKMKKFLAEKDFQFRNHINAVIDVTYQMALTEEDIKPEDIQAYLDIHSTSLGDSDFQIAKPSFPVRVLTIEEHNDVMQRQFHTNPNAYTKIFKRELSNKFLDYKIAYQNKKAALERSEKDAQEKQKNLEVEKSNAELSAALDATSSSFVSNAPAGVKALKKVYKVEMEETIENAIRIMGAFTANKAACMAKMNIKNWFSITPASMCIALAKLKNDDNNFQPSNITFVEVDKL